MTRARRFLVAALVVAALSPAPFACGPFFPEAIFTTTIHPDIAIERYVNGNLEIVQPTYARVYLYVAYRHLSGKPFPEAERAAVLSYWEADTTLEPPPPGKNRHGWDKEWTDYWAEVRDSVAPRKGEGSGGSGTLQLEKPTPGVAYGWYTNCLPDAFRSAVQTFQQRRRAFGANSPFLQEWVRGQETVFENCATADPQIPSAPISTWPALLRADRQYQIAAAHFYARNFDAAREMFAEIFEDAPSPWRDVARLLEARSLIRQGTLKNDSEALGKAEQELKAIVADSERQRVHASARRLLGYVQFRLHPEERGAELAANLVSSSVSSRRQDMIDYTRWLDQHIGDDAEYEATGRIRARTEGFSAMANLRQQSELTDWILTFQAGGPRSLAHALDRWEKSASVAWLLAALVKADAHHPEAGNLIAAAEQIPRTHPGYVACAFHALRLLAGSGRVDAARDRLDQILQSEEVWLGTSAQNAFRGLRMKLARDLPELMRFAPRVPAQVAYEGEFEEGSWRAAQSREIMKGIQARFDGDAARTLTEQIPLAMVIQAAASEVLPRHLRRELALAAWTRAVILGRPDAADQLGPIVVELAPELAASMKDVTQASTAEEERFAAALLLLRFPGMRPYVTAGSLRETALEKIDSYRNNWWCSFKPRSPSSWHEDYYRLWLTLKGPLADNHAGGIDPAPGFLDADTRAAGEQEWMALQELPNAQTVLGQIVVQWARKNAEEPRVPEALHRVVRATRYGCGDQPSGEISREAFRLLHSRYPKSEWAQKTPYWFN